MELAKVKYRILGQYVPFSDGKPCLSCLAFDTVSNLNVSLNPEGDLIVAPKRQEAYSYMSTEQALLFMLRLYYL